MPFVTRDQLLSSYDYVIVGAGPSGCVLANRLSGSGHHSVLLIEAGGVDERWELHMPGACGELWADPRLTWRLLTPPQPHTGKCHGPIQGRMVGGSAQFNTLGWIRGSPHAYQRWTKAGVEGWSYEECMPYFKRVEGCTFKADKYVRGSAGPMKISRREDLQGTVDQLFIDSVKQMGFPFIPDINIKGGEGAFWQEAMIHNGTRVSPADAYLYPALQRENLHVLINTKVNKILIENGCATGVLTQSVSDGGLLDIPATREVIICGGTLLSPRLLLLSGIGDAGQLESLGIPVSRNLPGVGRNLQAHFIVPVVYHTKPQFGGYAKYGALDAKAQANREWFLTRTGPHSFFVNAGTKLRTENSQDEGDLPNIKMQFVSRAFVPADPTNEDKWTHTNLEAPLCSLAVTTERVYSRGSVTLQDANPDTNPLVDPQIMGDDRDVANAVQGVKLAREIFSQSSLQEATESEFLPGASVASNEPDLSEYCRTMAKLHHLFTGTCKMGSYADMDAVTDRWGRVWGVGGLRVADSSIAPEILDSPLTAMCMMIAEKISDNIIAENTK